MKFPSTRRFSLRDLRQSTVWLSCGVAALGLAILSGCGGSGSSDGTSAPSSMRLFATDDISTQYDHVWISIEKVDLVGPAGTTNVFSDAAGKDLDVRSLNSGGVAHYAFLGLSSVPAGTYNSMVITVDKSVTLVPTGQATGKIESISGANANGTATITVPLSIQASAGQPVSGSQVSSQGDLVADFDLSKWTESGGLVVPVVHPGTPTGVSDGTLQVAGDFGGTVAAISGTIPDQQFDLQAGSGAPIHVLTASTTTVFSGAGSTSASVTNGEHVLVTGTFNPSTGQLLASSIDVLPYANFGHVTGSGADPALGLGTLTLSGSSTASGSSSAGGTVSVGGSTGSTAAGTTFGGLPLFEVARGVISSTTSTGLSLVINSADNFMPSGTTLSVTYGSSTLFLDGTGKSVTGTAFQALATTGQNVEVDGAYQLSTQTLTALVVRIAPSPPASSGAKR